MFFLTLLLFIATTVIGQLLAPKNRQTNGALGDFNFPTAQAGRAIPVVYGTVKLSGGNTVWWGDLKIKPIKHNPFGFIPGADVFGIFTQVIGYSYLIGVQYMLCWGTIDELEQINVDNKSLPYTETTILNGNATENYRKLDCTGKNLFGGPPPGGQGGFTGTIDFYRGVPTQQPNDYLTRVQGRIAYTPGSLEYLYAGVGNGVMSFLSGGSKSKVETITATATHFVTDMSSPFYGTGATMEFHVVGTLSGSIATAFADNAFSSDEINFTIETGSTNFSSGDVFTLKTLHATLSPAYPKLSYAVLEQCNIGNTNQAKAMEFIVRRTPDPFGQGSSIANIGGDANAALMIYDYMTDPDYGLGLPAVKFDIDNFKAVAVVLAGEGLGLSVIIDTPDTTDNTIGEMLRHVDGIIYTDPKTGLWTLKLARADYDPTTLDVFDDSVITETPNFARGSWAETSNQVVINYLDRSADFNVRPLMDYDQANIAVTQEIRPQTLDYKMLSNKTNGALIATRVLRTYSFPLGKLQIKCNRLAWSKRMGDVFKFTWAPLGIANMVCRITHIGYGEVSDGIITIDAMEDIFGIAGTAFVAPPDSGWINPIVAPAAPAQQRLVEAPYPFLIGRYAMALAARGDSLSQGFQIWNTNGTPFLSIDPAGFTPIGKLSANYGLTAAIDATGFVLNNLIDVDSDIASITDSEFAVGRLLVLVDDEIMSCQTVTNPGDGTVTIANVLRGAMDTVPAAHLANAVVWFISSGVFTTRQTPILADGDENAKLLPENSTGVYPLASATNLTVTLNSRFLRPFPPGNVRIGGLVWGVVPPTVTGDLSFSWSTRNRLTQTDMVRQDATDVPGGGEVGQTFNVTIRIDGTLIRTVNAGVDTHFIYTAAQRTIDNADLSKVVTIEIRSNVSTLDSLFAQKFSTVMAGASGSLGTGRYEFREVLVGGLLL